MTESSPDARPTVAVLFGGRSGEHPVSCVTASNVLRSIDQTAYRVIPIGVTRAGRWLLVDGDPKRWEMVGDELPEVSADEGPEVLLPLEAGDRRLKVVERGAEPRVLGEVDVVLPLIHGPYGEDGTLQGLLELADLPYVGSGVLASSVSMDKHYMKLLLTGAGLPVGDHLVVTARRWERHAEEVRADVEELGWPVFVKPARAGSSIGVTKVYGPGELDAAVEEARRYDPKVIIEAFLKGREIEVGVLESPDGGQPATSLVGEVVISGDREFYDFDAKYLGSAGTDFLVPADLPEDVSHRARELSARAFEALACEGLARVDFFLLEDGTLLVNEINTLPGFTPLSMFPMLWRETGLPFPDLIDRLLRLALRRPIGLR